jgi:hypothetical protein
VAGISYTQLSTVINGAGDPSPAAPLPGAATNISGLFAIVGATHALLEWSVAAPERSTAQLSSTTATQPSLTPDRAGGWTIQCQGFSTGRAALEATYLLPLDVAGKAATTFANPLEIRAAAPNAVVPPFALAGKLFPDSTNGNSPTWMYPNSTIAALAPSSVSGTITIPDDATYTATVMSFSGTDAPSTPATYLITVSLVAQRNFPSAGATDRAIISATVTWDPTGSALGVHKYTEVVPFDGEDGWTPSLGAVGTDVILSVSTGVIGKVGWKLERASVVS